MYKKLAFRLFLVLLAVFLMAYLSYYNVWINGDQAYTLNAPKDYVFLENNTVLIPTAAEFNRSVDLVSYGTGIRINAYFDVSPTFTNETIIGYLCMISLNAGDYGKIIANISVTNASNSLSLYYDVPPGEYRVISFVNFYFTGLNYTTSMEILKEQPGNAGIVTIVLPLPEVLYLVLLLSGISAFVLLVIAFRFRKEHYISFNEGLPNRK